MATAVSKAFVPKRHDDQTTSAAEIECASSGSSQGSQGSRSPPEGVDDGACIGETGKLESLADAVQNRKIGGSSLHSGSQVESRMHEILVREAREAGRNPNTQKSLLRTAQHMESLAHALHWDQHKYKSTNHVHRIWLEGSNSWTQPWAMPPITDDAMTHLLSAEEYYAVAKEFERVARWTQLELIVQGVLLLVLPPLATHFAERRRWIHYSNADTVIKKVIGERFFKTLYTRVWEGFRVELNCDETFSSGWLDIFNHIETESNPKVGNLRLSPPKFQLSKKACKVLQEPFSDDSGLMRLMLQTGGASTSAYAASSSAFAASSSNCSVTSQNQNDDFDGASQRPSDSGKSRPSDPRRSDDDGWGASFTPFSPYCRSSPTLMPSLSPSPSPMLSPATISIDCGLGRGSQSSGRALRSPILDYPREKLEHALNKKRNLQLLPFNGDGSYLAPLWLDIGDFLVYSALRDALGDTRGPVVVACINALLQRVDRSRLDWRDKLSQLLLLLRAVNTHLRERDESNTNQAAESERSEEPGRFDSVSPKPKLGVVQDEENRQIMLCVGLGEPSSWELPKRHVILDECEQLELPGYVASSTSRAARVLDVAAQSVGLGTFESHPMLLRAAAVLLTLQIIDFVWTVFVLGDLFGATPIYPTLFIPTLLVMPFAALVSPIFGLVVTVWVISLVIQAGRGVPRALSLISSGSLVRVLRISLLWNATAMPNALVAVITFGTANQNIFVTDGPLLGPLSLLATKLCVAQAGKLLAAAAGFVPGAYVLLGGLMDTLPGAELRFSQSMAALPSMGGH